MATTPPFDPFTQTFTLLLADSSPFNVTIPELDDFVFYNVNICINYASQLGGSLILLIVLLLLTKTDKRQSPIFILNALCLSLNTIRNILQCLYFAGPFSETYAYFGQDYSRVPRSTYATSVTATVLTFLLLLCVELSLILQVRVVCVTLRDIYRRGILVISVMIALVAIGFRLALCVENSRYIVSLTYLIPLTWLGSAANITTSISVCWFCAVFVTKLGFALEQRRKLGMGTFGPMQVIFIMGCQTLIIPGKSTTARYLNFNTKLTRKSSHLLHLAILHQRPFNVFQRIDPSLHLPPPLIPMGIRLSPQQQPCSQIPRTHSPSPTPQQFRIRIYRPFRARQSSRCAVKSIPHCNDDDRNQQFAAFKPVQDVPYRYVLGPRGSERSGGEG